MRIRPNALFTDLYQLTMLQGYFCAGMHRRQCCFELFFRRHPFNGNYSIAAGLADALDYLQSLRFTDEEIEYLSSLNLFSTDFLAHLKIFRFQGDVHAVPEGTPIFPGEPLVQIQGALEECQLVESALLNLINFQSLIATKAARICSQAGHDNVLEFGMRRAQGVDGSLAASRAAFIGGCSSTSNVEAGRIFDIPVSGTHAHSWVMAFADELSAFRAFAETYREKSILLVDTYETLVVGVPNAIAVAKEMKQKGVALRGIRLDSGDMVLLSKQARRMLDEAGLPEMKIVASSDLDEYSVRQLKQAEAPIDYFGIGTRLVTGHGDPSFTGVYKIVAVETESRGWRPTWKTSDEAGKSTLAGIKQIWRLYAGDGTMVADILETKDRELNLNEQNITDVDAIPLLQPMMIGGKVVSAQPELPAIRERVKQEIARLPGSLHTLDISEPYPVLIGKSLKQSNNR